jgi:hypothetical protein
MGLRLACMGLRLEHGTEAGMHGAETGTWD